MTLDEVDVDEASLIEDARTAMENAYVEYSDYAVGAAILTDDSETFTGCNIENINYTNTLHAEQTALAGAINSGYQQDEFVAIAISTAGDDEVPPCGLCRQMLSEFCPPEMPVLVDTGVATNPKVYTVAELLPDSMRACLDGL